VTGCPLVWIPYQKNGLYKEFEDARGGRVEVDCQMNHVMR
jgi:hypothetical protein